MVAPFGEPRDFSLGNRHGLLQFLLVSRPDARMGWNTVFKRVWQDGRRVS